MAQRKKTAPSETNFVTQPAFALEGFEVTSGDLIKIKGEYGSIFKVRGLTTNIKTGAFWVDCFEIIRGVPSAYRAFKLEKIRRVPQKGRRARRVV